MNKIKCLIVDDEELARELLKNYVARLPHLQLVGACKNPLDALQLIHNEAIDLVFLDIQMPELTGTQFVKSLSQNKPLVIFTTAYSEFALEGYALDVVDYLLKPFGFERFLQAANKAGGRLQSQNPATKNTAIKPDFILVKSEHRVLRLRFDDILYIEGMAEYVAFHTRSAGRVLSLMALKNLEKELPDTQFLRVHKSYIVSIPDVAALEGNQLVLGKVKLPIGASYREVVHQRLF